MGGGIGNSDDVIAGGDGCGKSFEVGHRVEFGVVDQVNPPGSDGGEVFGRRFVLQNQHAGLEGGQQGPQNLYGQALAGGCG